MNNNELEKVLLDAKEDANRFFSGFSHENMNRKVLLELENTGGKGLPRKRAGFRIIGRASAISACFVLIAAMLLFLKDETDPVRRKAVSLGEPVSQQMINLDNKSMNQWLNYFIISKPDQTESSLLAVIWRSGSSGNYEMAYSSLFENSSRPLPVAMIAFPGNQPPLAVISSQNDNREYIHYRILGSKENEIRSFMEQNYVAGGEIEVTNGLLKETRLVPREFVEKEDDGDMSQVITYYIPYRSDKYGDIVTPVESIKLHIGEHIAIVGDESEPIEASNSGLLSEWEMGSKLTGAHKNVKFLYAVNPGSEVLDIRPLNGGLSKKIYIEIVKD